MPRQRLGVVLLVPQPLATQIDGVRQALGDGSLGRIAPHITLVPPVNVTERNLPAAFALVRNAAGAEGPFDLRLGPVDAFAPVNPVAYLRVSGEADTIASLERLRSACNDGPLTRTEDHDFVPHVTIADELRADRLAAAIGVLSSFDAEARFDRVYVLAEQPGRLWQSVADAPLGETPAGIGRGSLPLDITTSGRPDAEAAALLAVSSDPGGLPFAVTARREGVAVAAAWGWSAGPTLEIADLAVAPEHRSQGIARHLLAGVEDLARRRGCTVMGATAPAAGAIGALLSATGFTASDLEGAEQRRWHRSLAPVPDEGRG